jgi:Protein of unknown function (DUF2844)
MTFSSLRHGLLLLGLAAPLAWAGLGEAQSSVQGDGVRMHAKHAVENKAQYAVHELKMGDGSRVRQYVSRSGRVFAVSWHTLYKPDLSGLLGESFALYQGLANQAVRRGGVQRQFQHAGNDLVLQAAGHMNVYSGYAYRPTLLPPGVDPRSIGLG